MANGDRIIVLKTIKYGRSSPLLLPQTSKALSLLCDVISLCTSTDSSKHELYNVIKSLKKVVQQPCCGSKFLHGEFPVWNHAAINKLECVGLSPSELDLMRSIIVRSVEAEVDADEELIPPIIYTLIVLDYSTYRYDFEQFISVMARYPHVGLMLCEILSDDELSKKAKFLLGKENLDHQKKLLFQSLNGQLRQSCGQGGCPMTFHFAIACGEHLDSIVPRDMEICMSYTKFSKQEIEAFVSVLSKSCLIEKMLLISCNLNGQSLGAIRDGLKKSCLKIGFLDVSFSYTLDVEGYSCLGSIAKDFRLEDLNVQSCTTTCDTMVALSEALGEYKLKQLQMGPEWCYAGNDAIDGFRDILSTVCMLSLKTTENFKAHNFFPWRNLHGDVSRILEGILLLQDFIYNHHSTAMTFRFGFQNPPEMHSNEDARKYIQRLEKSTYFKIRLMGKRANENYESKIFTVKDGKIKLAPIESRIRRYQEICPKLHWIVKSDSPPSVITKIVRMFSRLSIGSRLSGISRPQLSSAGTSKNPSGIFAASVGESLLERSKSRTPDIESDETLESVITWSDHTGRFAPTESMTLEITGSEYIAVTVGWCTVDFPPGVFKKPQTVTVTAEIDSRKWPPGRSVITPTLYVEAENLNKLLPVKLTSWCSEVAEGEDTTIEILCYDKTIDDWKVIETTQFRNLRYFEFRCKVSGPIVAAFRRVASYLAELKPIVYLSKSQVVFAVMLYLDLYEKCFRQKLKKHIGKVIQQKIFMSFPCKSTETLKSYLNGDDIHIIPPPPYEHSVQNILESGEPSYSICDIRILDPCSPDDIVLNCEIKSTNSTLCSCVILPLMMRR